jgi:hypothetical protein
VGSRPYNHGNISGNKDQWEVQMPVRFLRSLGALAIAIILAIVAGGTVEGQGPANTGTSAGAATWTPPRTADGRPDLQGNWTNNSITPLQRPKQWAGRLTLTDAELAQLKQLVVEVTEDGGDAQFGDSVVENALAGVKNPSSTDSGTGNYNHFWLVDRTVHDRRTSLLIDPPDGRLPPLTEEARKRQEAAAAARGRDRRLDNPEDRGLGERCVNFGVPKLGAGYNSYYQIVQTPGHVVFVSEMAHDARIIPLDGRPHVPKDVRLWNGDPRGRWEGDTLVVESTNFSPKSEFRGSGENLHLVERFTRVGPDTLNYQVTVTDPTVWTKSWTAMIPLNRTDELIYEYACHEGNYRSMEGSLKGTRVLEQEAATGRTTSRP